MIAAVLLAAAVGAADPVTLVDPFVGTGGTSGVGLIDTFPGPSAPFGMVQWSPDTPSMPPSGGYFYHDTAVTGFSLTHLSGAGCAIFGDFSMLPTLGDVAEPAKAQIGFKHADEQASPGYYAVMLANGVRVELATTARAGFGRFTFPPSAKANLLINTSSDQAGVTDAHFRVAGPQEIVGSASSGGFCGMPNSFTVYVDIRFDRPFVTSGTWKSTRLEAGATEVSGPRSGGWITFDTTQNRTVDAKVSVSYVSIDGARHNVDAENAADVEQAHSATANAWRALLGEVQISGGTPAEQRLFYTSLYHAALSPTLYSDADGSYRGFDAKVHRDVRGHDEYANYSGWDIYRTQLPLISLLAPDRVSDMMQTLVHNAQQGGWLPKWPVANGYTGVMGGDSADPMIAGAYAFGARKFDRNAALHAMLKNAKDVHGTLGQGWYYPRPGLEEYLAGGFVTNAHTTSVSPVPNGASETLEYAIDDFAISQFARTLGRYDVYRTFARRAMNWTNVFDTAHGLAASRDGDGAFVNPPITENGQSGFQEGNAAQYTWMVPQSLATLVYELGGPASAIGRLDQFFSKIDAGQTEPYAWFGNEPTIASPWTYLYAGAPYKAQSINRNVMLTLYAATPDGIPGNDDLGTMSSWWAWNAMGLYPLIPGTPTLVLGTPLFTHVSIASPSGRTIEISAPEASDANAYIEALRINGVPSDRAWFSLPDRGSTHLDYSVGATPNLRFGSNVHNAPPSFEYGTVRFPPSTTAALAMQRATIDLRGGDPAQLRFSIDNADGAQPVAITWQAQAPQGIVAMPSSGTTTAVAANPSSVSITLQPSGPVRPGLYNVSIRGRARNGATLAHVTGVVRVPPPSGALQLAFIANFSDDSILPIDPRTHAFGTPIAVGSRPGDLAVSRDGSRVYTANQGSNDVSVVDAIAGNRVTNVKVGGVPAGIRLSPDEKTLWVSNYDDGTLQAIDVATLQAGPPIAVGNHPEEVAVAPDGSVVYVVDQGSNELAVVSTQTRKVVATVQVGEAPLGVVVSRDGSHVYVGNSVSNDVSVVDAKTLQTIQRVPVGKAPQGMALSPDGTLLYVTDSASSQITPINTRTNVASSPILVGNGPFAVVFNSDGKTALVANSGDNTCAVVDVARSSVLTTTATGSFPIAIGAARQ